MLIDEVKVRLYGGHGGRGAIAFQRVKLALGPTGATGGHGGSIYVRGVSNIGALSQFQKKKDVRAKNGEAGKAQFNDGHDGPDIVLDIPVGTVITNLETSRKFELTKIGEEILVIKGGYGGKGNFKFRSPTDTSPRKFQEGLPGEEGIFEFELKMIADVGLVGLPNAGKSSLLNALTAAKSKVANYEFTTLEAHLGAYHGVIIADIPGLIEGAASGKGLGIKFLRHVERTRVIFHLVPATSDDHVRDYKIIRGELGKYNPKLLEKDEYVFLSKSDEVSEAELKSAVKKLKVAGVIAKPLSIIDDGLLLPVRKILEGVIAQKTVSPTPMV
ncbi:MAG: Obg family GTPase CgtA [Candidatus Wildermuthbacteria bacterium RIFCSPHIGHO2_01_FULL_49_22b]|uniref:Obg family GTPase CgtA n=1 Tax=Candidatus Wildermuthbacteria bacterium RIFCSPHIGHO2_01_FULL_49_22b TaxID=1802448 RepID=A0A1G2QZP8_9BACT|nr:MAG: Obg family GTPase CgtA [Candidatus Wildermuthbacteria bacterium RIFCSPHIGHO2_01_FULL_49_22b]